MMAVPLAGRKRLVIVGATGMVGRYALRYALEHSAVGHITAIGRRTLGISHPRLKEVLHRDLADCSALAEPLSGQDAAVFCLGTYTGSVSDAALRTITLLRAIYPAFRLLLPNQVIRADDLARAMVDVAIRDTSEQRSSVFENRDIRAMVASADVSA